MKVLVNHGIEIQERPSKNCGASEENNFENRYIAAKDAVSDHSAGVGKECLLFVTIFEAFFHYLRPRFLEHC